MGQGRAAPVRLAGDAHDGRPAETRVRLFQPIRIVLESLVRDDWELVQTRIARECAYLDRHPEILPPLIAQLLLVSGEDHRNRWHPGFDPIAIGRAVWRRIAFGSREGASTIEQQLVRTITGKYERRISRKLREILLATLVSRRFLKCQLPAVYLNIAYYGWRMNGYGAACQRLRLPQGSMTLEEAAGLVARLKYPEPRVAPLVRRRQIQRRSRHLLRLFKRHLNSWIYGHLNDSTFQDRTRTLNLIEPIPQPRGVSSRRVRRHAIVS